MLDNFFITQELFCFKKGATKIFTLTIKETCVGLGYSVPTYDVEVNISGWIFYHKVCNQMDVHHYVSACVV